MKRLLKPTAAFGCTATPTMSHYLKLMMDAILGPQKTFATKWCGCYKENDTATRYFLGSMTSFSITPAVTGMPSTSSAATSRKPNSSVTTSCAEDGSRWANMKGKAAQTCGRREIRDWWPDIPIAQAKEGELAIPRKSPPIPADAHYCRRLQPRRRGSRIRFADAPRPALRRRVMGGCGWASTWAPRRRSWWTCA